MTLSVYCTVLLIWRTRMANSSLVIEVTTELGWLEFIETEWKGQEKPRCIDGRDLSLDPGSDSTDI